MCDSCQNCEWNTGHCISDCELGHSEDNCPLLDEEKEKKKAERFDIIRDRDERKILNTLADFDNETKVEILKDIIDKIVLEDLGVKE